jgi:hypothetical protein
MTSVATSGSAAAFRAIQRRLAEMLERPSSAGAEGGPSLEAQRLAPADPPRLARARAVESAALERRAVSGTPEVGFAAFLDGVQISRIALHDEAIPVIHGAVGAVVRQRIDRRLTTWRYLTEARLYAPRGFLSSEANAALNESGLDVTDTTPRKKDAVDEEGRHPLSLADVAVSAVQAHREVLELRLAESWVDEHPEPLYVDGGISGSNRLATSDTAVGVVKSHRTLYGDPAAVRTILTLNEGERSTVFAVASPNGWRSTVASWYLRLREGGDPLFGLVRIETRMPADSERSQLTQRADQVSRWVMAESSPIALPDSRWDTMAYGIRDCEQYLRSILR